MQLSGHCSAHSGRGYPQGHPPRPRPGWRRDRRHRLLRCRACPLLAGRGHKGLVGGSSRSAVNLVLGSEPRSGIALQSLLDWCSRTCASQLVAGAGKRFESTRRLSPIWASKPNPLRKAAMWSSFPLRHGTPRDGSHTPAMAPAINSSTPLSEFLCS
jgi:hypothetical protein